MGRGSWGGGTDHGQGHHVCASCRDRHGHAPDGEYDCYQHEDELGDVNFGLVTRVEEGLIEEFPDAHGDGWRLPMS